MLTFYSLYKDILYPKLKYAASSSVGTLFDYLIFLVLYNSLGISALYSHVISYSFGAIINFFLHKNFIFDIQRKALHAFLLSISFSVIGLMLSSSILWMLLNLTPLVQWPILAKVITSSLIFLFNYYSKQYAFERSITKI